MDINIVETTEEGKDFSAVASEDVVILPAFGASYQEMKLLNDRSVHIVDTTCPWVCRSGKLADLCNTAAGLSAVMQALTARMQMPSCSCGVGSLRQSQDSACMAEPVHLRRLCSCLPTYGIRVDHYGPAAPGISGHVGQHSL